MANVDYEINTIYGKKKLLSGLNRNFYPNEHVGIIAAAGEGKSSLAKLLSGIEVPTKGLITHTSSVSWPIGFAGAFHPDLNGYENIEIIARLIGEDPAYIISFCHVFGQLQREMSKPLKRLSPASRAILAYCCSMAVYKDIFIADGIISVGDIDMRKKCDELVYRLLENSGLIFLSKNIKQLKQFCTQFLVLIDGKLQPCSSPEIGFQAAQMWEKEKKNYLMDIENER